MAPAGPNSPVTRSGACVEDSDRAPVLRPARNIVADRDWPFLAVVDRAHAMGLDTARGEKVAHGLRAPCPECDVVFAGAALVRMSLDQKRILRIGAQPLRLAIECRNRLRRELRGIGLEEDTV